MVGGSSKSKKFLPNCVPQNCGVLEAPEYIFDTFQSSSFTGNDSILFGFGAQGLGIG
jgi:hypothetical protein